MGSADDCMILTPEGGCPGGARLCTAKLTHVEVPRTGLFAYALHSWHTHGTALHGGVPKSKA